MTLSGVFFVLVALHIYWGFGGRWGWIVTLPREESGKLILQPTSLHCFLVAAGLTSFGLLALLKIGVMHADLPQWLPSHGLWAVAIIFLLRAVGDFRYVGFFKKKSVKLNLAGWTHDTIRPFHSSLVSWHC